jgi:tripartite ATP-independent transporter DctP family solute receptor
MKYARRDFIKQATFAAAGVAGVTQQARAAAQFTYKYGISLPADHPITLACVSFADGVRRDSGGRLDIKVFPSSQLGGDTYMLQQLRNGALEMFMSSGDVLSDVVPAAAIDHVGFAFSDDRRAMAALNGELGAYIRSEMRAKNIFTCDTHWGAGLRQTTTSTHPIRTVADMAGLKIRVPSAALTTDMFRTLGATPTSINASEMYSALQTRIVDAMEGTFLNILSFKTYEVQKYLSVTNHQWVGFWLCINPASWAALSPDLQTIVMRNSRIAGALGTRNVQLQSDAARTTLAQDGLTINNVDNAPFRAALGSFYTKWKGEFGATAWGLLEKYAGRLG